MFCLINQRNSLFYDNCYRIFLLFVIVTKTCTTTYEGALFQEVSQGKFLTVSFAEFINNPSL